MREKVVQISFLYFFYTQTEPLEAVATIAPLYFQLWNLVFYFIFSISSFHQLPNMTKKSTLEEDSIVEVKQDFMVSPSSHTQSALAYLLKSIANLILKPTLPPSSFSSSYFSTSCFDPKICSNGWHYPPTKWVRWVDY